MFAKRPPQQESTAKRPPTNGRPAQESVTSQLSNSGHHPRIAFRQTCLNLTSKIMSESTYLYDTVVLNRSLLLNDQSTRTNWDARKNAVIDYVNTLYSVTETQIQQQHRNSTNGMFFDFLSNSSFKLRDCVTTLLRQLAKSLAATVPSELELKNIKSSFSALSKAITQVIKDLEYIAVYTTQEIVFTDPNSVPTISDDPSDASNTPPSSPRESTSEAKVSNENDVYNNNSGREGAFVRREPRGAPLPPIPGSSRKIPPVPPPKPERGLGDGRKPTEQEVESAGVIYKYLKGSSVRNQLKAGKQQSGTPAKEETKEEKTKKNQRALVIKEIQSTEESYVNNLDLVSIHFIAPLKSSLQNHNADLLTSEQISNIFSCWESIRLLNHELLTQIKTSLQQYPDASRLGRIFIKIAPMMKMYSAYVSNFDRAVNTLRELKSKKSFVEFCERSKANAKTSLSLEALLIMPVQRVPRYQLLFRELIKLTPNPNPNDDSSDSKSSTSTDDSNNSNNSSNDTNLSEEDIYKELEEAKNRITELNRDINDMKRRSECRHKLFQLYHSILDAPRSLIAPSRLYILEGDVLERFKYGIMGHVINYYSNSTMSSYTGNVGSNGVGVNVKYKHNHLFVFSDILIVCKKKLSVKNRAIETVTGSPASVATAPTRKELENPLFASPNSGREGGSSSGNSNGKEGEGTEEGVWEYKYTVYYSSDLYVCKPDRALEEQMQRNRKEKYNESKPLWSFSLSVSKDDLSSSNTYSSSSSSSDLSDSSEVRIESKSQSTTTHDKDKHNKDKEGKEDKKDKKMKFWVTTEEMRDAWVEEIASALKSYKLFTNCGNTMRRIEPMKIRVRLIKGTGLLAKDVTGKSDPYVIVELVKTGIKIKSNIKYKTLAPEWDEDEVFVMRVDDPSDVEEVLVLRVMDWDMIGKDEDMGKWEGALREWVGTLEEGKESVKTVNLDTKGSLTFGVTALGWGVSKK